MASRSLGERLDHSVTADHWRIGLVDGTRERKAPRPPRLASWPAMSRWRTPAHSSANWLPEASLTYNLLVSAVDCHPYGPSRTANS